MIENTFGKNIIPANDPQRLAALASYRIMDTPKEDSFDNIARLCTKIFQVPIALVSLVDTDRVFFKANVGMGSATEANRGKSLCALAVLDPEVTVFEDALKEPCLVANPNVAGDFGLRFYAGAPITTAEGMPIGTLCIIDKKPRNFSEHEADILKGMAVAVMDQIELRLQAMLEIDDERSVTAMMQDQQQQMEALNEEMTATNEQLQASLEELSRSNELLHISHQRIAESELRFRSLINQSPIATAVLKGAEMVVESANQRILEIWGKDKSVIGKPLIQALPEIQDQPFPQILKQVFESGESYYGEEAKLFIHQDGVQKEIYVNFTYQPFLENGKTIDIMVVAVEVTEQVNSRKYIEETNTRLAIAMDASALGQTEVVLATGKMESTDQFKANYGYQPEEEFTYADLFNSMFEEYREPVKKLVQEAMRTNGIYKAEYPVRWRDGSVHWISAHGRPRYDSEGKPDRMVGMTADITAQKIFQQQKDDFLSIASHELKTPITSLKASMQLLDRIKDKPMSPMHVKLIEQSNRAVGKVGKMVDELLTISRLSEGQLQLNKEEFVISEMLELCCNHVRVEEKYELIISGEQYLKVNADEHRIEQVVVNFVNNAVKYAPNSKQIHLNIEKLANDVKVSVTDSGPGIPKATLPFIFDRYYRNNHDGKEYSGLGLGLYICSEIIKNHGGQIGVDSELGKGSTFWFTLPL